MRLARPWLWSAGLAGVALLGAGALALGPLGAPLATTLADGRRIGPLGVLHVEGVRGARLADLKVARLTLTDSDGVWLDARDIDVSWRPLALLAARIEAPKIAASGVTVLRAPKLGPLNPNRGGWDLAAPDIAIARLDLAPALTSLPEAAAFAVTAGIRQSKGDLSEARFNAQRIDGGPDTVALNFTRNPAPRFTVAVESPQNGAIAALIGAPLSISGSGDDGAGQIRATIAGAEALTANAAWRDGVQAQGQFNLITAPKLAPLLARLGATGAFTLNRAANAGPFAAAIATDRLKSSVSGRLTDSGQIDGAADFALDADARLADFTAGRINLKGALRNDGGGYALDGALDLKEAVRAGLAITASGPGQAQWRDQRLTIATKLTARAVRGPQPAARLLSNAVLDLAASRDNKGAWSTPRLTLVSDGVTLNADRSGQAGRWRLNRAALILSDWRGAMAGDWRLQDNTLQLTGAGDKLQPAAPLDQLLGPQPKLTATLRFVDDRVDLSATSLEGPKLRIGVAGPIRNGVLDLKVEAAARGPLKLGDAEVAGAGTASGALTGPANAWRLKLRADLATLDIAGGRFQAPRVDLDLAPTASGFAGPLTATARFAGQPATLTGALASGGGAVRLNGFTATLAQARAKGDGAIDAKGLQLSAALNGRLDGVGPDIAGKIGGRLAITPGSDNQPNLDLDVAVTEARFAGARATGARLTARGPFGAVRFDAAARGAFDAAGPFSLTATGGANLSEAGQIQANLSGDLDGRQIRSRSDAVWSWRGGGKSEAQAAFTLDAGSADIALTTAPDGFRATLKATRAPLAMLAGRAARLAGEVSGQANLIGRGADVSGDIDLRLDGVDLAGRQRDPVNATLKARLSGKQLALDVAARSGQGLTLNLNGAIPVETSTAPLRIARAGAPARLNWDVAGPIDSVWRIAGPLGIVAGGAVQGKGALVLAAPGASGPPVSGDGAITLTGGRVEDRASGVRLNAIDARAVLRDDGLVIERLSASDGQNGKLTAQGRIGAAGQGELAIALDDFRLIKRPDVTARGDGDLKLAWTTQGARLTGAIDLIDADARQPLAQAPAPDPIAVIEINRPNTEDVRAAPKPPTSLPVALDLKLTGARRLFTRARGLEAEWALDARVQGTAARPLLFGEARLLRGQSTLAGRPLTFERGLLRFDGPIEATRIDMRARIDAPNLTAALTLSGPLNDPELETTSTPALPQDEILPQALFGVNAEQLSPLQAAQLAATLAVLSGRGAFDIANVARAAVNLDRLDLREEQGGLLLTGGKYITRDVYLEVSRGAQGQTTSALEWQVRPRLFLISSFEANGDPKLAVRWRREY